MQVFAILRVLANIRTSQQILLTELYEDPQIFVRYFWSIFNENQNV
jgi:hypothetical protein